MDISETLIGSSDQLDNVDLMSGPRDFTITGVSRGGNSEQPINFTLAEFPRPWRPGLTMRRLLAAIWNTTDANEYVGRRVRLYRDPKVTFGKTSTGGTRISHASHLEKAVTVPLPVSRGQFRDFTVHPLPDAAPQPLPRGNEAPDPLKEVGRLMKKAGITERAHAATYVSDVVGREVGSTKELTGPEVEALIESLKREVGEE